MGKAVERALVHQQLGNYCQALYTPGAPPAWEWACADAAQGVHARRGCGTIAFEIPTKFFLPTRRTSPRWEDVDRRDVPGLASSWGRPGSRGRPADRGHGGTADRRCLRGLH